LASLGRVAAVNGAGVGVVAVDGIGDASQSLVAGVVGTLIRRGWAGDGSVDTGSSGGIASVVGASVLVTAVVATRLTISVADSAPVLAADHPNGGVHPKVRLTGVSLAEEEIKGIHVLRGHSDLGLVDLQRLGRLSMHSSQIDDQLVVHIDPDVIVSSEGEDLVSAIREPSVELEAEGKVVPTGKVSKSLIVDGEEETVVIAIDVRIA